MDITGFEFENFCDFQFSKDSVREVKPAIKKYRPVNWDKELQWFQDNYQVFERYKGKWVAIKGDRLIAHDVNYQNLVLFCKTNNIDTPLIQYIPNSDNEWNLGLSNCIML